MSFLPSVPLLFPPDNDSYLKASLSTTGDLEECSKDPQRVLGRAPADNTFWVGASDPILTISQLRGLRTPSRKIFWDIIYAILRAF